MTFTAPYKILIQSDNNELEFIKTIPKNKENKEPLYVYKFSKSLSKKGMECMFTENVLRKLLLYSFKEI